MEPKLVQAQLNKVSAKTDTCDASHSFSKAELQAYSDHINFYLSDDPNVKDMLPIKEDSQDLFPLVGDGIIFCKLINKACPGTILEKAINLKKPLNIFQMTENLNLAINSAKAIGCVIVNIHSNLILEKREHIILGILWQIIRHQILSNIDLKNHPYLIRLKEQNEELQDLLKLNKEVLLLRWINYHLKNAGHPRKVTNFDKDLMDGENYIVLLNQLDSNKCDKSGLNLEGLDRAKKIIADAQKLGVPKCIKPTDIVQGNSKINVIHMAHIFNNCPGLQPSEQELFEAAKLIDDDKDQEASREDRVYRMWMNSLNIENVYINNLIQDMKDGTILSQIINHIQPGAIDLKKISPKVNNKIFRIQNNNYVVESCKKLGLTLVGIGGTDIADGNKKLVLAIIWQLMRHHTFSLLGKINEDDILKWANSRVESQHQVKSFKDETIKTSTFLLKLLASIEPRAINWELVPKGDSEEQIATNAKYTISVARKLGIPVFLVWEHIKDVNQKFISTFVACIKHFVENTKK